MARFRYSMQSILNIKMKMETQAKQEFSAAAAALEEEEKRLQALHRRKRGYEEKAKALLSGALNVRDIEENRTAILCMKDYIEQQKAKVKIAEDNLEKARAKLTEVRMERKTHEILKEKAFEEFLMEEKRRESKEIDELTSYTYGQRRFAEKAESIPV